MPLTNQISKRKPIFKLEKLKQVLNNPFQPKFVKNLSSSQISNDLEPKKKKKKKSKHQTTAQSGNSSAEVKKSKSKQKTTSFEVQSENVEEPVKKQKKIDSKMKDKLSKAKDNFSSEISLDKSEDVRVQKRKLIESEAKQRLRAASFRILNEKMYSTTSADLWTFFQEEDPESYTIYHEGYRQQVNKWPVDPLDLIIQSIQKMPLKKSKVLADLGCGEARLAQLLGHSRQVHSFDLKALNEHVVECDIAELPLKDGTVDVVVFCLSLMGTNLRDYLFSAARILKIGGVMKVAEVESRFENTKEFVTTLKRFGFKLIKEDTSNSVFILMDFVKRKDPPKKSKLPELFLNPCLYKKR